MTEATTAAAPPIVNLPNILTSGRLVLAIVLFVLIGQERWLWCLFIFSLATVTDWLDGYLARRQGLVSTLGRNLDPLVDKVLICGAYIFLLPFGMMDARMLAASAEERVVTQVLLQLEQQAGTGPWLLPWMVTLIVARELIITGLRSFLENQGATFGADWLGKSKMVLQCAALISVFVQLAALQSGGVSETLLRLLAQTRDCLIWAMLAATALSGLQYLWKAAALLTVPPSHA